MDHYNVVPQTKKTLKNVPTTADFLSPLVLRKKSRFATHKLAARTKLGHLPPTSSFGNLTQTSTQFSFGVSKTDATSLPEPNVQENLTTRNPEEQETSSRRIYTKGLAV